MYSLNLVYSNCALDKVEWQISNVPVEVSNGLCDNLRACEQCVYFCEQFEQRPNFAGTFKLNGIIRYPFLCIDFVREDFFRNTEKRGLLRTVCF